MAGKLDEYFEAVARLNPVNSSFARDVDGDDPRSALGNPSGRGAALVVGVVSDPFGLQGLGLLRERILA